MLGLLRPRARMPATAGRRHQTQRAGGPSPAGLRALHCYITHPRSLSRSVSLSSQRISQSQHSVLGRAARQAAVQAQRRRQRRQPEQRLQRPQVKGPGRQCRQRQRRQRAQLVGRHGRVGRSAAAGGASGGGVGRGDGGAGTPPLRDPCRAKGPRIGWQAEDRRGVPG